MKVAPSTESVLKASLGSRERFVWQAVVAALLVHVITLAALAGWGDVSTSEATAYAEVDFADFALPQQTQTMEEAVRAKMQAKMDAAVRNVAADANAARNQSLQSSAAASDQMARDVEAELRAFEQSAFDALAEGRSGANSGAGEDKLDVADAVDKFHLGSNV